MVVNYPSMSSVDFGGPTALDGTVEKIEYVSGPNVLKDAAIAAIKQWSRRRRR